METPDSLYGPLQLPDWPSDLIVRALRMHGEWAAIEAMLAATVVPESARLWDLGAFLGTFSMGVARSASLSSVLAVEANPELAAPLRANLETNLNVPVQVFSGGVGQSSGWIVPRNEGALEANHGAQSFAFQEEPAPGAIACRALRDLRTGHGGYDFLKMDLEGMERQALIGDHEYIRENKPVIWAECNEEIASLDLFEALHWLGYRTVYVAFPAFRADNYRGAEDLLHPFAYEAALLAAPDDVLERFAPATVLDDIIVRPIAEKFDLRRALYDTPRWGRPDWQGLSRPEMLARMGRILHGVELKDFLKPPQID
ncbi:FkbM family methyltransferase [Paracoccus aurantiacus]|uniref:FkbM family methyltransferase n=1 Tax=Paracoccus aurantiacus TaxID=2599412 RepID=UPI00164C45DE|nr:FkbM family methyltransferase [Paracoccus aurantiacus]